MSAAVSPTVAPPPADSVRIAVLGRSRWALWWRDELAADPRFALLKPGEAGAAGPDATLRCEGGRVTIEVPHGPDADALPFRPARFSAAFAAARSAMEFFESQPLGGSPRDFTLVEHTQTPLGDLAEHGTALDRLEARLDELLALSNWTAPRLVHATRVERGDEVTLRAEIADETTGGRALIEIVRGAAVRWESGWNVRTPAGAYHGHDADGGTLTTREPAGELAPRPWTGEETSPRDALHAWLAHGAPWPVTAEQTKAVAALMSAIAEKTRA